MWSATCDTLFCCVARCRVVFVQAVACEVCGVTRGVVRHHDDYALMGVTRPLCARHHAEWHRDNVAENLHLRASLPSVLARVTVYMDDELRDGLKARAKREHRSLSQLVLLLVEDALAGGGGAPGSDGGGVSGVAAAASVAAPGVVSRLVEGRR